MNEPLDEETRRAKGLEIMKKVYGWDHPNDSSSDFFALTAEHLFAEVWSREVLSVRERRLLLIGLLVGQGLDDQVVLQLDAVLRTGDLTSDELREVVVFLTHYAGWSRGSRLNTQVEDLIARVID